MTRLNAANQIRAAFKNEVLNRVQLKTKAARGVEEFMFHPERKWRFDLAWPDHKIALEVEGAVWTQGRHTRGSGFVGDIEKYNAATLLSWRVFRCVWSNGKNAEQKAPAMDDGTAADLIIRAILGEGITEELAPPIVLQEELPFSLEKGQVPLGVPFEFLKGVK